MEFDSTKALSEVLPKIALDTENPGNSPMRGNVMNIRQENILPI
jgi:hypothetical protein